MSGTSELKQQWLQMGVELEGGWAKSYRDLASEVEGAKAKTDGSLSGISGDVGEIITRPYDSLEPLLRDVKKLHPNYANETAGFHVHASFTAMNHSLLTSPEFWSFYQKRWNDWGKAMEGAMKKSEARWFWDRLLNRTEHARRYCKGHFDPAEQLGEEGKRNDKRYTQLNFCSYHKHKTVESRLLPMFTDPEITIASIKETAAIYDLFLNTFEMAPVVAHQEYTEGADGIEMVVRMRTPSLEPLEEVRRAKTARRLPSGPGVMYHLEGAAEFMLPFAQRIEGEHA